MFLRRGGTASDRSEAGTFVLSVDVELMWGVCDRPDWSDFVPVARTARKAIPRLLQLLDHHRIPATWALVGHLVADCRPGCGPLARSRGEHGSGMLPCRAGLAEVLWRLDGLGEALEASPVDHDVGSHGFWHLDLQRLEAVPRELIGREPALAHEAVAGGFGPPVSFVFPRNRVARCGDVAGAGFRIVRTRSGRWYETDAAGIGTRSLRFADEALRLAPSPARIEGGLDGLTGLSASQHVRPLRGWWRRIPRRSRVVRARRGLEAAESGSVFHLWLHPHDLVDADGEIDAGLSLLDEILVEVRKARAEDRITVKTMRDFATRRPRASETRPR